MSLFLGKKTNRRVLIRQITSWVAEQLTTAVIGEHYIIVTEIRCDDVNCSGELETMIIIVGEEDKEMLRAKILKPLRECSQADIQLAISSTYGNEDKLLPTLSKKVSMDTQSVHPYPVPGGGLQRGYSIKEDETDTMAGGKHRPGTRPRGCPCCHNDEIQSMIRPEI